MRFFGHICSFVRGDSAPQYAQFFIVYIKFEVAFHLLDLGRQLAGTLQLIPKYFAGEWQKMVSYGVFAIQLDV